MSVLLFAGVQVSLLSFSDPCSSFIFFCVFFFLFFMEISSVFSCFVVSQSSSVCGFFSCGFVVVSSFSFDLCAVVTLDPCGDGFFFVFMVLWMCAYCCFVSLSFWLMVFVVVFSCVLTLWILFFRFSRCPSFFLFFLVLFVRDWCCYVVVFLFLLKSRE